MAKFHGRNASIYLDSVAGASTAVGGDMNTATLDLTAEAPEVTGFGDTSVQRLSNGIVDWTLSCDGFYNNTTSTAAACILYGLLAGSTYLQFGPNGSTSGCPKFCASGVLTSVNFGFGVNDAATVSFEVTGRSGSVSASLW